MEPPELIEVREEERFDVSRLASFLEGRIPGAAGIPDTAQFPGGHANLTYLLAYPEAEYVLRRPPLGPVAPGSHDMAREYKVLSQLWRSFPPAPRAYVLCEDESVIGSPFFVMERRRGVVIRNNVPERFGAGVDQVANRRLSEVVIDTLADLHAVDPDQCGLGDLGHPEGFLHRQVQGWLERWQRARHEDNAVADQVADWVADHIPTSPAPTLVHNDWRLDNMAVAFDDPGRCVAVYDWDMCTRGDPLADLGTVLAVWYGPGEVPATLNPMPTTVPGFLTRAQALERYGRRTGRQLDGFDWYLVFGTWKLAVVLQQIFIRWLRGQTRDTRFADMGDAAKRLFELAVQRTPSAT
ncbi:MAG TPA: phosphotransferase family protein [Acidimicrobiia bacterium]|nr:phosphotransferase family protein [Acidimicrobiia bacterium]